jgi:hypothetical protein
LAGRFSAPRATTSNADGREISTLYKSAMS